MIKIWGRKNSINVQKVLWCCDELEIPWQRVDMGLQPGDVDTPAYRELNPNGLVPTIEDDGFVLWESNTILRYLAGKYAAHQLWPTQAETRADADRWMDWHISTLWLHMRPMFWQYVRFAADQRDQAIIDASHKNTQAAMKILDTHLAANRYVAGSAFSIGDIPVGVATYRWQSLPIERPELPNLQAWYVELGERAAYREHIMQPMS